MAEKIAVENGRISNFEGLLTLTLDRDLFSFWAHVNISHCIVSYMPNITEIEETFCGQTDVRMDARTYVWDWLYTSILSKSRRKNVRTAHIYVCAYHCAQLSYTTQHRAVLIIFPLILQTSTTAQMLMEERGDYLNVTRVSNCYSEERFADWITGAGSDI